MYDSATATQTFDRTGYDADGYSRKGYDRRGFDRRGFHRTTGTEWNPKGFDVNGLNANGYDRDGYDVEGRDSGGFDRTGFNGEGFNRNGYDREGFNRGGLDSRGNLRGTGIDRYETPLLWRAVRATEAGQTFTKGDLVYGWYPGSVRSNRLHFEQQDDFWALAGRGLIEKVGRRWRATEEGIALIAKVDAAEAAYKASVEASRAAQ